MIGKCHRRTLTAALVILGAGLLQGCAYGTYADASAPCCAGPAYGYSGYPAYGSYGYPAYDGYGGAVVAGGAWGGGYYGGIPIGAITTEGEPPAPIIVGVARVAAIGMRARVVPIDRKVTQAPIVAAPRVVAIDLQIMQPLIRPQTGRAASEHAAGGEGIEPVATTTTVLRARKEITESGSAA